MEMQQVGPQPGDRVPHDPGRRGGRHAIRAGGRAFDDLDPRGAQAGPQTGRDGIVAAPRDRQHRALDAHPPHGDGQRLGDPFSAAQPDLGDDV